MAAIEYRLYINDAPATRQQLNRIEEITVEQEVNMAWEARLMLPVHLDESGNWIGEDDDFIQPFSQLRVEIRVDGSSFVPLIDGPIVRVENPMSSEPGSSSITLHVHDDTIHMNRDEVVVRHENRLDHEIASQLFRDCERIASTDIEQTPAPTTSLQPVVVQRGTPMQLLRNLARRQGKYVYVLPGESPGRSVGCFKSLPIEQDGLPPLILIGSQRNIDSFNAENDAQQPSRTSGGVLNIADKSITSETSRFSDIEGLGDDNTFEDESDTGNRLLSPLQGDSVDLGQHVAARTHDSSYAIEASGNIMGNRYQDVLSPYRIVCVQGANKRLSGNYLIYSVTHTITRSEYSQSFSLRRNGRSAASAAGNLSDAARGIF